MPVRRRAGDGHVLPQAKVGSLRRRFVDAA
jgi:hypothetical protein